MTLARKYNRLLKSRLLHYAAWSPVTDGYAVGDFGAFRRGVFQKLGNIREFGVDPGPQPGASAAKFDFTSAGTHVVRFAAGVKVDVFPQQPVEAKLEIEFKGEDSFYVRTSKLTVSEMKSVDHVAQQLKGKRDANGRRWKLRWRIVRKVYTAVDPAILASAQNNAGFTLSGRADALKALEIGNASGEITVASTDDDVLQIAGGTGPVALDLFRVRAIGGAGLEAVGRGQPEEALEGLDLRAELDDEWPAELEDEDYDGKA